MFENYMVMKNGKYLMVKAPEEYPGKKYRGKYCYEHHLVIWGIENRILKENETTHHINEDKHDNKYENLRIVKRNEHNKFHLQTKKESNFHICDGCGKKFYRRVMKKHALFCSRNCYKNNWYKFQKIRDRS